MQAGAPQALVSLAASVVAYQLRLPGLQQCIRWPQRCLIREAVSDFSSRVEFKQAAKSAGPSALTSFFLFWEDILLQRVDPLVDMFPVTEVLGLVGVMQPCRFLENWDRLQPGSSSACCLRASS